MKVIRVRQTRTFIESASHAEPDTPRKKVASLLRNMGRTTIGDQKGKRLVWQEATLKDIKRSIVNGNVKGRDIISVATAKQYKMKT